MKICFLTHSLRHDHGAGVLARSVIEGLRRELSCEVEVLTTLPTDAPYAQSLLSGNFFLNFFRIRKVMKSADIIHAFDIFPYGLIAVFFSLGLRKKIIVSAVGSGSIIPLYQSKFSSLTRFAYKRADALTAISRFTRDEILKKLKGVTITVVTPGVDFTVWNTFVPEPKKPFPLPKTFLVSVGSLRWRKGYKLSIRAFAEARKKFPALEYVIVGKKYTDKEYQKLILLTQELGLSGKVHILDSIDDVNELKYIYSKAELFILMSQNDGHDIEGFGMVFLEAASVGLPVIGSNKCGVEDAVRDGKNGFLVDSKDVAGAAKAMIAILEDGSIQESMRKESLEFVKQFSWQEKVREYAEVYSSLGVEKKS